MGGVGGWGGWVEVRWKLGKRLEDGGVTNY